MTKGFPWFRMYAKTWHNAKVQRLNLRHFRAWINLLCIASEHEGVLPSVEELSHNLRMSGMEVNEILLALVDAKLLIRDKLGRFTPHEWDEHQYVSDSSTKRVKKHRANRSRNVSETPSDTDTDTDTDTEQKTHAPSALPRVSPINTSDPDGGGWMDFQTAWLKVAETIPSSEDWRHARRFGWDPLPFADKLAAVEGILRVRGTIRGLPRGWIEKRAWERGHNMPAIASGSSRIDPEALARGIMAEMEK